MADDKLLSWELRADHTLPERARVLAEMALADFVNDRLGMVDRAAFRIADALAKYEKLDVSTARHVT